MKKNAKFDRYDIIAVAQNQKVVYYKEFGEYQGDWLLIAIDKEFKNCFFYKGYYGSCTGCDIFEEIFDKFKSEFENLIGKEYDEETGEFKYYFTTTEIAQEIVKEMERELPNLTNPFLVVDLEILWEIIKNKNLKEILPKNIRYYLETKSYKDLLEEIEFSFKKTLFPHYKDEKNQTNSEIQTK